MAKKVHIRWLVPAFGSVLPLELAQTLARSDVTEPLPGSARTPPLGE